MKKKRILGIVTAMLMVIALALTGCGQQGEQNAGATGSESQNGTITDNGNENNGEATAEPEEPDVGEVDNRKPEMRDGMYVYEVLGEEFLLKTNVWDFIDEDAKTFDFGGMENSLGLGTRDGNYFLGNRALSSPHLIAGDVSEACFLIYVCTDDTCTKVDHQVKYTIKYSANSSASREYASKSDPHYGFTFDLIVLTTYGCEHLKDDLSDLPLGDHLTEYYNEQKFAYELP